MASQVTLLQLSPTMSEGTIVKWLVKEGDEVSSGMPIAEVETDKAVMEQEAFEDGKVLKILVPEGERVEVGNTIMISGEEGEDISSLVDQAASKPESKDEKPKKDEKKKEPAKDAKESVKEEKKAPAAETSKVKAEEPRDEEEREPVRILASPLAKKMAKEADLDLSRVKGTGPNNRITKRDVEAALSEEQKAPAGAAAPAASQAPSPEAAESGEEIKLTGMRQTIARRLTESKQQIPHFQLTVEVRGEKLLEAVEHVRAQYPDAKVTVSHFLIKAMAANLMRHKELRSQWAGDKLVVHPSAHVSVAVAIDEGLVTPVIRNAQGKGVVALAAELRELAGKARDRKLTAEDMSGGTQTLSNLGMFGIHEFNAIINPPEATILAVGAMEDRPVVENGQLVAGKVMKITMSCDHRVVDGAVGARYLSDLRKALEDPLLILV